MLVPTKTKRVLGAMVLTGTYNNQDICIMGYLEKVYISHNHINWQILYFDHIISLVFSFFKGQQKQSTLHIKHNGSQANSTHLNSNTVWIYRRHNYSNQRKVWRTVYQSLRLQYVFTGTVFRFWYKNLIIPYTVQF